MIKIAVCGACGRMGSVIREVVSEQEDLELAACVEAPDHPQVGDEVHGVKVVDDLQSVVDSVDVVVDFTHPDASVHHAEICGSGGRRLVIGTTGLSDEQVKMVEQSAAGIPMVLAPNMSVGVNFLFRLADMLGRSIPGSFDVEIIEAHHRMKKDAPSGTAARLARIIEEGRDISETIYGREGIIGERPPGQLAVHTIRGGDIVGEHTLLFVGDGERFEITHRAHSRRTFAAGVPLAVRFAMKADPGLYDMMDVLGLHALTSATV